MSQGILSNPVNNLSVELVQKPKTFPNNGIQANILEINRLINLLDRPLNEIVSYLSEDNVFTDDPRHFQSNWNYKKPLSSSNSFTSNKTDAERVTQDLDHLLTSLSQYKLSQSSNGNLYDENENSLGPEYLYHDHLQAHSSPSSIGSRATERSSEKINLQKLGDDKSSSIPLCSLCNEPIYDNSISALDCYWHQHHFICYGCETRLESAVYYVDNQQPYCETCHINMFTDKCAYCAEPILDTSLTALGQHWHPEHFFCSSCQGPFENDVGFHEHLHKPYCSECYFELFGSRCAGCNEPITSTFLSAMGYKWHNHCFVCKECRTPFETFNFHEINGEPYCSEHYHIKMGMICGNCKLPITSSLVNALGKKFHVQCFTCSYCLKSLAKCTFKESESRPYCNECFMKLCPR